MRTSESISTRQSIFVPHTDSKEIERSDQGMHGNYAPTASDTHLRSRRSAPRVISMQTPRLTTHVQKKAESLVKQGDQDIAAQLAATLMNRVVSLEPGGADTPSSRIVSDIPLQSTFGLAWSSLTQALNAEPFATYAKTHHIDTSECTLDLRAGTLQCKVDGKLVTFGNDLPGWAQACAKVMAVARKLAPTLDFVVYAGEQATRYELVQAFYSANYTNTKAGTLDFIRFIQRNFSFPSLHNGYPDQVEIKPEYADVKQRQVDAIQTLADRLVDNPERFSPQKSDSRASQLDEADRQLAQTVGRFLWEKNQPALGRVNFNRNGLIPPEASTLGHVLNALDDALAAPAFLNFAAQKNIILESIHIAPQTGDLLCKVEDADGGVTQSVFKIDDESGWSAVAGEIVSVAKRLAAGSTTAVRNPLKRRVIYPIDFILNFYAQNQDVGELKQKLEICSGLIKEGFAAARKTQPPTDERARAFQALRRTITDRLERSDVQAQATPAEPDVTLARTETTADSLARADSELAVALHKVMLELKTDASNAASKTIEAIPPNSLFGRWQTFLSEALKSRGFTQWAEQQNIDPASLRFDPTDKALVGKVNGVDQRFTNAEVEKNHPEYFDALKPVLTAAEIVATHGQPITLSDADNGSAPFEWVARFYGMSTDCSSAEFVANTELIGHTKRFPTEPEKTAKILNWLNRQVTAVGNSNDRYALIDQLKNGNIDNDDDTRFRVDPHSSHQPKGVTTVQRFLADQGWYPATTSAQTDNLLLALQTPVPSSPALGNRWGFLSTAIPLSTEQRSTVTESVKKSIGSHDNLLSYLSAGLTNLSTDPEQALDQLLSSDNALALATHLQSELKGAATETSLKQWLLTALVLEVDPMAGSQRNVVARFDVMQPDNWGHGSEHIIQRFNHHLTDSQKVPANLAPVVSHLMLSGLAPHLIVKEQPQTLTLGSPEWVSFTTAVNRIEQIAPGASANMTYQQVMDFHRIAPLSAAEARSQAIAQMNPVIDWAIINNHLVKSDKDEYTLEQLSDSQEKLQKHFKDMAEARRYLSKFPPPNRRAMALQALKEKFGDAIDYHSRDVLEMIGGVFSNIRASIVEIYEAGRLGGNWHAERSAPDFDHLRAQAAQLPDINQKFDAAIEEDFTLRRKHTLTLFKDMLSKLPLEERNSLNYGAVEFLRVEGVGSGMVMTSSYKGVRRDFAVYPTTGQVVRIPDIDPSTPLGQKVTLAIDAQAFTHGSPPKQGVTSEVVLRTSDQFSLVETHDGDKRPLLAQEEFRERSGNAVSPTYDSERMGRLAKVLVDTVYLRKREFVGLHRGSGNAVENGLEPGDYFQKVLRVLPGGSSLLDVYHGEYLQAAQDLAVDIAIYATTEGLGKVWNVAKSGAAWAAAKVSSRFIEKLGTATTENIALREITASSTANTLRSVSRLQGSELAEHTAESFIPTTDMADGSLLRSGASEKTKLTAVHQDGEWYAYNARTMAAQGPALKGFVPESNKHNVNGLFDLLSPAKEDTELDARYQVNLIKSKHGEEAAYQTGYDTVNPNTVPGYRPDMGAQRIKQLIADSHLGAEQVGSLVRQRERLIIGQARINTEVFKREVEAVGGTVRGMPQSFYLSLTHVDVEGECAALSNAMALALSEGTEHTLIDNLALAMANPESVAGSRFMNELSSLQARVGEQSTFHGAGFEAPTPYKNIITQLSNPNASKTLMISSENHGMVAGVRVDPVDASKKTWFHYDPNYGLATFTSEDSMKAGLEKVLNSGSVGKALDHYGNALTGRKYRVSVFNPENIAQRKFDIDRMRALSQPLLIEPTTRYTRPSYGRITLGGPMETVRPLDGEIQTFVDTYDGKPRLNIIGHAPEPQNPGDPVKIVGDNNASYSAAEVNQKLLERGVDIRDYPNVRTLTCFSASGGDRSFSAELHRLTGVPVKGFEGPVTTEWLAGTDLNEQYQRLLKRARAKHPKFKEDDIQWLAENDLNKIFHNQFRVFSVRKDVGTVIQANIGTTAQPVYITLPIDYRPVRFGPP